MVNTTTPSPIDTAPVPMDFITGLSMSRNMEQIKVKRTRLAKTKGANTPMDFRIFCPASLR